MNLNSSPPVKAPINTDNEPIDKECDRRKRSHIGRSKKKRNETASPASLMSLCINVAT